MKDEVEGGEYPDRRQFVRRFGGAAWGAWLSVNVVACGDAAEYAREAAQAGLPFQLFGPEEGRDLEAFCATLIPSGDTPGATEAGAAHFIDRVLGTFETANLPTVREGLVRLSDRVGEAFTPATAFADLGPADRIQVLESVEVDDATFFGVMRYLTICGTFCHPDLGGNRDRAGWRLLEMDVQSGYEPPFGYYDRPYHEAESKS